MGVGGLFCYLKVTKMVKTFVNSRNSYTFALVKKYKIMKKRILLSTIALCFTVLGMVAQRTYTFNAVALNVDGLPESILGVSVNDGAPGASGATLMGNAIAKQNWDIVGLSEDFNYHAELTAPLTSYYHVASHGGTVSGLSNSTDGLGLLVGKKSNTGFANETSVEWNTYNGTLDNGNDGLIEKGFRYYAVTIASGVVVDVYVLHMDAGSSSGDITAREKQLTQLATYIKGTSNKRPIIIIGDTNCRYTREQLKTGFIDVINADSRFTIKDAWIEKIWKGTYPTYGGDAMMWYNAPYNNNTGEVVDKIFYINNTESSLTIEANSYLHNTSFGVSDHYPVIVNFTVTDPTAKALTASEKEQANTLADVQAGSSVVKPTWLGEQVASGNSYYVMNVGTGKYIKVGATWQTQATSGYAGTPLTATALGDGKYALETVGNSRGNKLTAADYPYMDGMDSENHAWVLTPVNASGSTCQYYIEGGNGVLTATTEAGNVLKTVAKNAADDNQRWVFLTAAAIRREMAKASSDYPFNFTPLLPSADFDKMETDAGYASKWSGFSFGGVDNGGTASTYGWAAVANTTSAVTVNHALGTLPVGNYKVSFEGFYRSRYKPSGWFKKEQDETRNVVVSFGSTNIAVAQNTSTSIGTDMATVAAMFRDNDTYLASATASLSAATDVALTVSKPATSSSAKGAWICLDDFRLMFYGTGKAPEDPTIAYKQFVVTKVNETYAKVLLLNEAGQAAYDISTVMYRYNSGMVTTEADATALCAMVDEAYNNACAAHDAAEVEKEEENGSEGDNTEGDDTEGDNAEGDDSEGDNAEGNDTEGDSTEGDVEEEQLPTGNTNDAPWSITAERIPAIADNVSNWVVSGSWTTWTSTADGSGFSVPYVRVAKSGASSISKTLNYLPEGTYTLSASCMSYYYSNGFLGIGKGEKDVSGVTLFANSATTTINTKSGKAAKTLSVNVALSGTNTLKFGINATSSNKATILAMDNVELVYQGSSAQYISGINKITDSYISAVASTNTSAVAAALANLRAARKAYVVHLAEGVATPADVTAWTEAIEALADAAGTSRSIADEEDGTADIEAEEVVSEPIVVAVYTLGGVRIESVQTGLNILLMSDGTTRKVFVK